jgi:phage N-6-adenine-methyltransferase
MSLNAGMLSSKSPTWETPQWLFERLDAIFKFQLDAAASRENNKCERYLNPEHSAFNHPWTPGPVWLNPPYGAGVIDRFVARAQAEAERHSEVVVCLIPARTDTEWFRIIWQHARLIVFLYGRLKFVGAETSAPFPSALAIFSPEPLERYPGLLATVASIGFAVDPTVLRSSESLNLELSFPPHTNLQSTNGSDPNPTRLNEAIALLEQTLEENPAVKPWTNRDRVLEAIRLLDGDWR